MRNIVVLIKFKIYKSNLTVYAFYETTAHYKLTLKTELPFTIQL